MTKERLENLAAFGRYLYANGCENISELVTEIMRCHTEIERLETALEGSESLRHTIMTAALDAKRTFTKRISELEQINERLAAAYHELQGADDAH